jgi:hypothetical protein
MLCTKCSESAATLLSYDYAEATVWLDDRLAGPGHVLCAGHADKFTPPVGWVLVDRRGGEPRVMTLEVA